MKKINKIIIFIVLLLLMALFPYIPIMFFKLDYDKFNYTTKILYNFTCDIGFMIIIFFLYNKELIQNFKEYFKNFKANFEESFKYYFIGLAIMIISNILIVLLVKEANANNENTVRELISKAPLYMIFSVSIYAPFIEEIIFRKSIKDAILTFKDNKNIKYLYILASGLIFGLMHIIGSATSIYDYIYIIPYAALGVSFAALYYKKDNIFYTITIHSMHNTLAIILYFIGGLVWWKKFPKSLSTY